MEFSPWIKSLLITHLLLSRFMTLDGKCVVKKLTTDFILAFLSKSIGVARPFQPHSDGIRIAIRRRNARQLTSYSLFTVADHFFELNVIYERGHLKPCLHARLSQPKEPIQPAIHLHRNSLKFRERKIVRIQHET